MNPASHASSRPAALQPNQRPSICKLFAFRGVLSREKWMQRLQQGMNEQRELAVLLLEIDRPDGTDAGTGECSRDRALITLAERLRRAARSGEVVGHLHGACFAILVPRGGMTHRPESLGAHFLAAATAEKGSDGEAPLSVSIGVATAPLHGTRSTLLLSRAELALKRARRTGGGMFLIYDFLPPSNGRRRQQLVARLRRAVAHKTFRVAYQPIMGADGCLHGAEASLRWDSSDAPLSCMMETALLLEETGLSAEMGLWLLRESCRQSAQWRGRHASFCVHVRLNRALLQAPQLTQQLHGILTQTQLPPDALHLQIGEELVLSQDPADLTALRGLSDLGVRIWLDHAGTASDETLVALERLPVDGLKIDRSFVMLGHARCARQSTQQGRKSNLEASAPMTEKCSHGRRPNGRLRGVTPAEAFLYGAATAPAQFERVFL